MPTKARYLEFDDNPDLENEFFVAQQLSMTVGRLREEMSEDEYRGWLTYYARRKQEREVAHSG